MLAHDTKIQIVSKSTTLASVAQLVTVNRQVAGLITSQGTSLGCGFGPQMGRACKRRLIDVSLSHDSYLPLALLLPSPSKINKHVLG